MRNSVQRGVGAGSAPAREAPELSVSTAETLPAPAAGSGRQSGQMPLGQLIAAQEGHSTLQVLENLARANRQIGTLAAVLAAEADKDCPRKASGWRVPFPNKSVTNGFVETGIHSVIRQCEVPAMIEPVFKIQESTSIFKRAPGASAATAIMPSRTKSQMLVDRLRLACNDAVRGHDLPLQLERSQGAPALTLDLDACLRRAGVAAGPNSTRPVAGTRQEVTGRMDVSALAELVATRDPDMPHADFIRLLASQSGEAAQFFNYIDHALLIKNSANHTPCNRYEYTDDFELLGGQIENKGVPWLETFLPGVERSLFKGAGFDGSWRVLDDGEWRYPSSRREVLDHVFLSAISHLHAAEPTGHSMPIYPLVAYELLGDAIGHSVPDYLIAYENGILESLRKNASDVIARKTRQLEDSTRDRETRIRALEFQQQRVREGHVYSASQLYLCNKSYDRQKVTGHSLDRLIPVTPLDGDRLALMRNMQATLANSHDRQTVSYADHASSERDHLCWLRAGWLSLFCMRTPDQLANRLEAICQPGSRALECAPILAGIANRFHTAPAAFMHNENTELELSESLSKPARLGPAGPLQALIPSAALPPSLRRRALNTESWLKDLQCDLAMNFRFENKSVVNEVEALGLPGVFASSDMLVYLHRAFQTPCLIIEAGLSETGGAQHAWSSVSIQLRVAAVEGTALTSLLNEPENESPEAALHRATRIFREFEHSPVIWLEREHFELYFPKSMTQP